MDKHVHGEQCNHDNIPEVEGELVSKNQVNKSGKSPKQTAREAREFARNGHLTVKQSAARKERNRRKARSSESNTPSIPVPTRTDRRQAKRIERKLEVLTLGKKYFELARMKKQAKDQGLSPDDLTLADVKLSKTIESTRGRLTTQLEIQRIAQTERLNELGRRLTPQEPTEQNRAQRRLGQAQQRAWMNLIETQTKRKIVRDNKKAVKELEATRKATRQETRKANKKSRAF